MSASVSLAYDIRRELCHCHVERVSATTTTVRLRGPVVLTLEFGTCDITVDLTRLDIICPREPW